MKKNKQSMDIYSRYEKAKCDVLDHFYDDVNHFLINQKGITWERLVDHFKTKYSFYDFYSDELSLFNNYLERIKGDIINTLRNIINETDNTITLIDMREFYKFMFPQLKANSILDIETCRFIDNEICGKCGHQMIEGYDLNMTEGMFMNDNNDEFSCINVGIFTFDQVIIVH